MNRIVLPFEQESASSSQQYGGTGLGLSITKNLVTLMDGTLSVNSEQKKGTTFTAELDFDVDNTGEQPSAQDHQALETLKVLVADDDRDCCIHTSLLLHKLGILSQWVLTGIECVDDVLTAHKTGEDYDVCLIDWKMPGMDGMETCEKLRQRYPEANVFMVSSLAYDDMIDRAVELGAKGFLFKPFTKDALLEGLQGDFKTIESEREKE